jgi:hypothetical protein
MRKLAKKLGANYLWGVFNYTFGVACGAFLAGFIIGAQGHGPNCGLSHHYGGGANLSVAADRSNS